MLVVAQLIVSDVTNTGTTNTGRLDLNTVESIKNPNGGGKFPESPGKDLIMLV